MTSELQLSNGVAVSPSQESGDIQSRFLPVMSIATAVRRFKDVEEIVAKLMEEDEDFGKVPGSKKPSLWKPGAEKLCNIFGLVPRYEQMKTIEDWTGEQHNTEPFFYYRVKCSLYRGDFIMGEGEGSCNSWESKYRYRLSERVCPSCGKPSIIKGKAEYGGGYVCFKNKGGCGAKFNEKDPAIGEQVVGKVANPDIFDLVNTVLKMANKRAQIAATLNATGASRFFTQDVEDMPQFHEHVETGGHAPGTQAAADYVAERKLADYQRAASQAANPPKSANPPKADRQSKAKDFEMLKVFGEFKKSIGDEAYYRILGTNGYEHADEIPNREIGKRIKGEMQVCADAQAKGKATQQPAAEAVETAPGELWEGGRE